MADMVLNLGRNILDKGKRKAPATDPHEHNDDMSSTGDPSDQSPLFARRGSPATGSEQPGRKPPKRQKPSEKLAELRQQRKNARTAATTPEQFGRPPRPFVEEVEDEDDGLSDQPSRHDRRAVTRQPSNETQVTSNVAGKETDAGSSRVMTDPPQDSRNAQPRRPGARATPSIQPDNSAIDPIVVDDDDEDDNGNGIPPGHLTLRRTSITTPQAEFGRAIRSRCYKECEAAAATLSNRTDVEGKQVYLRCMGTAALLKGAKTLAAILKIMANDVKDVLVDANTTLLKYRNKYNRYFESEDDAAQKLDLKRILDRQDARVEKVEQARNWRRDLVKDLREMPLRFLRRNISTDG